MSDLIRQRDFLAAPAVTKSVVSRSVSGLGDHSPPAGRRVRRTRPRVLGAGGRQAKATPRLALQRRLAREGCAPPIAAPRAAFVCTYMGGACLRIAGPRTHEISSLGPAVCLHLPRPHSRSPRRPSLPLSFLSYVAPLSPPLAVCIIARSLIRASCAAFPSRSVAKTYQSNTMAGRGCFNCGGCKYTFFGTSAALASAPISRILTDAFRVHCPVGHQAANCPKAGTPTW